MICVDPARRATAMEVGPLLMKRASDYVVEDVLQGLNGWLYRPKSTSLPGGAERGAPLPSALCLGGLAPPYPD
eukprot:6041029-Pyramimonas_sp.AAC.1